MYQPAPEVVAYIGVGGGTSNYCEIAEATSSGITDEEGQAGQATRGISRKVPAKAARAGRATAGTFSWDLNPGDASIAIRDAITALQGGLVRNFREDEGSAREVHDNTTGVSIAITAASDLLTISGSGTGASLGTNLAPRTPWDRGLVLVESGIAYFIESILTTTTAEISRIGAVASNVVTPDAVALADVAATSTWELYEYAVRREFEGTLTQAAGHSTSPDTRSKTIAGRMSNWPTLSYLLANDA